MAFYPTDFHAKIRILPPEFGSFITKFSLSTFHTSPWLSGAAAAAQAFPYTIDFRRRQPELGERADLGETVETAPAAHGTDSADTWTSAAPDLSSGAPSREGQGSRRLPDPAPAPEERRCGASSEKGRSRGRKQSP